MKLLDLPDVARLAPQQHGFFDDFQGFLTADQTAKYTVVTTTDGSVLQRDSAPGGVDILTAAATGGNEETYLIREAETFKFAANKPLVFEALVQATEDDTNQNNLIVGLTDGAAAALMTDNGGGPKAGGNTLAFYKVDGGLNWWIHARDEQDGNVYSVELTAANSLDKVAHVGSGAAHQRLRIEFLPKQGTLSDVVYYIDGVAVYKLTDWDFGTPTDMQAVCGAKDGDSGDEVTISLFYWFCYQRR